MNFELWLTLATFIAGICYGLNYYLKHSKYPWTSSIQGVNHYLASFFIPLFLILIARSFIAENYRIPSGSQKPTLLVGDFLIANKFTYGLRLPVFCTLITPFRPPQRGDVVAFRFPLNRSIYFIKRVVGLPGDRIQYKQKTLTINGKIATQRALGVAHDEDNYGQNWSVLMSEENFSGAPHTIYTQLEFEPIYDKLNFQLKEQSANKEMKLNNKEDMTITVPRGHYFVMGDNRDHSLDSRHWGFVPADHLLGKAKWVFFSWNSKADWTKPLSWVRWERMGKTIV